MECNNSTVEHLSQPEPNIFQRLLGIDREDYSIDIFSRVFDISPGMKVSYTVRPDERIIDGKHSVSSNVLLGILDGYFGRIQGISKNRSNFDNYIDDFFNDYKNFMTEEERKTFLDEGSGFYKNKIILTRALERVYEEISNQETINVTISHGNFGPFGRDTTSVKITFKYKGKNVSLYTIPWSQGLEAAGIAQNMDFEAEGVVLDYRPKHNSFGHGTATVKVKRSSGEIDYIVPWSISTECIIPNNK